MDGRPYSRLIVLLDGASASGKSTIKNRLLADPALDFPYVRRYKTRARRADDAANPDYEGQRHCQARHPPPARCCLNER